MKKILLIAIATLSLSACHPNNEEESIAEAAKAYCQATSDYDIDAAEQFCTEESVKKTLKTTRHLLQFVDSAYIASDSPAKIDILKVKQLNDTSAFAVYHKVTPLKDFVDTLHLRKRLDRWLVHTL